jgi:phosphate-selective porin OprO/OprP
MKIILLLLSLEIFVFALNPKSCYTVQLVSTSKSTKNYQKLASQSYDASCKILEIGSVLTVRCGCFDNYKDAQKHLQKLDNDYMGASIATTYKSRFATKKISVKKTPIKTMGTETIELGMNDVAPVVVSKPLEHPQRLKKEKKYFKKTSLKPKNKKPKKKKNKKEKKLHKKKKSHKQKVKFVKKKERRFFYDRYIKMLKHDSRGRGSLDYRYSFGGQISYDLAYINEASDNYNDRGLRRMRLWHDGSFFDEKLFYELNYSFLGNNHYKNFYLGYNDIIRPLNAFFRVKIGNIKIPFSLESYNSSKYITFMERALNDTFSISRKVGAELLYSQKFNTMRLNFFGAYFTNSIDERIADSVEQEGFSSRVTLANSFAKREILHCGFGIKLQNYKGEKLKLKQGAESNWIKNKYVSVKVKNVDSILSTNMEFMYIRNKYYFQSEFTKEHVNSQKQTYDFYGYYLEGSYFVFGRGKRFKMLTSTMSKVKPKQDGALELAIRYAYINLNDKDREGGEQRDVTLGVNWYLDDKLKVSGNYILSNPKETSDYDGIFQVWQARVLFFF